MQPNNNSRQNPTGRPSMDGMVARGAPMRRPVVNDFAVRRPAYGAPSPQQPAPRTATPTSSVLQPAVPSAPPLPPHPKPATTPPTAPAPAQPSASVFRAAPTTNPTTAPTLHPGRAQSPVAAPSKPLAPPQATPTPPKRPVTQGSSPTQDRPHAKPFAQPKHERSHAGLVGFIMFVLLSVVAFAPFVSGVILQNAPGSSQSVTSGTDTIGCAKLLSHPTTTTAYTSKIGLPIVYSYTQTTTYSATCEGKRSSVISSRESQFNPLGALVDLVAVVVLATTTAKLWKFIRER